MYIYFIVCAPVQLNITFWNHQMHVHTRHTLAHSLVGCFHSFALKKMLSDWLCFRMRLDGRFKTAFMAFLAHIFRFLFFFFSEYFSFNTFFWAPRHPVTHRYCTDDNKFPVITLIHIFNFATAYAKWKISYDWHTTLFGTNSTRCVDLIK